MGGWTGDRTVGRSDGRPKKGRFQKINPFALDGSSPDVDFHPLDGIFHPLDGQLPTPGPKKVRFNKKDPLVNFTGLYWGVRFQKLSIKITTGGCFLGSHYEDIAPPEIQKSKVAQKQIRKVKFTLGPTIQPVARPSNLLESSAVWSHACSESRYGPQRPPIGHPTEDWSTWSSDQKKCPPSSHMYIVVVV